MPLVRDNTALSRFELDAEGGVAFANYRRSASLEGWPRAPAHVAILRGSPLPASTSG